MVYNTFVKCEMDEILPARERHRSALVGQRTGTSLTERIDHAERLLKRIEAQHPPVAFASSFSIEDMVLTDLISKSKLNIEILTLDTCRLPEETQGLIQEARRHYDLHINVYFPDSSVVEAHVNAHGPRAFYESVALRRTCCHIRKVEPLRRALKGKRAWITGLRREQSLTRSDMPLCEWDEDNQLHKFNPLAEWSTDEVWAYIWRFEVPYNALYDKGYASIGCAPCTRAITGGEDIRAGRWWWENAETKECGLHPESKVS